MNPCIYPELEENAEEDTKQLAKNMQTHFIRVLLAWWKAAHCVFSQDTRLYYIRTLQQLISGKNKLFKWPAFVKSIHIDVKEVNIRKDNPRIWFEYQTGYEYLANVGSRQKIEIKAKSFATNLAGTKTPAAKQKRSHEEPENEDENQMKPTPANNRTRAGQILRQLVEDEDMSDYIGSGDVAKNLYLAPAARRRENEDGIIEDLMKTPVVITAEDATEELPMQVSPKTTGCQTIGRGCNRIEYYAENNKETQNNHVDY